ncbi:MAG: hypothetical protein ACKO8U_15365, partial [Pirellula sp.]
LGKIIFGDQQVTLLGDPRRVAKPGANHMKWELALQFRLPAGSHSSRHTPLCRPPGIDVRLIKPKERHSGVCLLPWVAARYWGAATTNSLLSPKISNASSRIGRNSGKIGQLRMPWRLL